MTLIRTLAFLLMLYPAGVASTGQAQPEGDRTRSAVQSTAEIHQLAKELSQARRSNNIERAHQLQAILWNAMPTSPVDGEITALPGELQSALKTSGDLRWGDDVTIHSGKVFHEDTHPIAMVADTLGAIYVGVNAVFRDTLSQIRVYRSTDGGQSWGGLNAFYPSSPQPIHSFDMCITDTAGGKFLIGIAFTVQFSPYHHKGGKLYWGSMLSDGTGLRFATIASADSGHLYGNPSICTDGDKFAPSQTYHFVASEYSSWDRVWKGLYITHSTNWGKSWIYPDTSIKNILVENPALIVDHTTMPESLCVAYHHQGTTTHHISVARNSIARSEPWGITPIVKEETMNHPRMAIDPVRGNVMLTYGWYSSTIEYLHSRDLFQTYTSDTISVGASTTETSVRWSPSGGGYIWRIAYRTTYSGGTIYVKAVRNAMSGFTSQPPLPVNQYKPSYDTRVVVGQNRQGVSDTYRTNCIYAGDDDQNVYFDAGDVTVDVPTAELLPDKIALAQNWPNPFNPTTVVSCQLPVPSSVRLAVYDLLGREVEVLIGGHKAAGTHSATWDATGLPSGVYFYRLMTGDACETKKMLLLR